MPRPLITDGLVAYYPFDGDVKDYSGNGYDGKWNGNAQYNTGKVGQAAKFIERDYNQFIELPLSLKDKLLGSDFTVSLWFNPSKTMRQNGNHLGYTLIQFSKCGSCGCGGTWVGLSGKDNVTSAPYLMTLDINDPSNDKVNGFSKEIDNVQINADEWYNIIFSNKYIYINGEKIIDINNKKMTEKIDKIRIGNKYCICGSNDPCHNSHKYNGLIDEVYIFNRVLLEDEIQTLYNIKSPNKVIVSAIETSPNINIKTTGTFYSDFLYTDYEKVENTDRIITLQSVRYKYADVFIEGKNLKINGVNYGDGVKFFLKQPIGKTFNISGNNKNIIVYHNGYWSDLGYKK